MDYSRNQILIGDCIERMRELPDGIVQCTVTSPPYFALRSYLPADHPDKSKEIGSEPTPDAFIATMVAVFREVRRIMRDDGVLFMNLGDSYNNAPGQRKTTDKAGPKQATNGGSNSVGSRSVPGTEVGDLLNIPHRVAEALRADGWNWRQTIIWAKKSPMPESLSGPRWERCKIKIAKNTNHDEGKDGEHVDRRKVGFNDRYDFPDDHAAKYRACPGCKKCIPNGGWVYRNGKGRCTTAHEYVFVFSKSERYFWDSEASKELCSPNTNSKGSNQHHKNGVEGVERQNGSFQSSIGDKVERRNPRSVWTLSTEPTKEKHFATFPSELVRRCLVAGASAGGCCAHCGKPFAPMIERDRVATRPGDNHKAVLNDAGMANVDPQRHIAITNCLGYRQACECPADAPAKQIVFDPFSGLCTVQQTARQLGHDWLGTELNPEYAAIGERRIEQPPRWWIRKQEADKPKRAKAAPVNPQQLSLFERESA